MGFFDKLLGKKAPAPHSPESDEEDDIQPVHASPPKGPPEFVRAVELQRSYWTHDAAEQARLEERPLDQLGWRERLRLHHLICLQRLKPGPDRAASADKCRRMVEALTAADSPYRPRTAMIWQGQSIQASADREPDAQGEFLNPSLTHLGCLEIYRVDAANQPIRLDFVGFDELSGVAFAPPGLIRAAKLFYDDGSDEIVLVPLLYGPTWAIGNEHDRSGQMTRFVAHLDGVESGAFDAYGIGVGQQDFAVSGADGGHRLFGLGSVAEIEFPLVMSDPMFDTKARARGIDPDEVRRSMVG